MRYIYIKYGNVVEELRQIGPSPETAPTSGPLAFAGGFLQMIGTDPALMISWDLQSQEQDHLQVEAITAHTYPRPRNIRQLSFATRLLFRIVSFRPNIVICVHDGISLWLTFLACRLLGVPLIHSRQRAITVDRERWSRRITAFFDGFILRRASGVICHGPFARDQLIRIGVRDSRIVEFDVRLEHLIELASCPASLPSENSDRRRTILFVGRVEESKGVTDLLEACVPILKEYPDTELVYVGEGTASKTLQDRIRDAGITSRASLVGRVPHAEIGRYLAKVYVLVAPTRRGLEGWPMSALESLAMGVPVIGPAAGPFPFMIQNEVNGLLFSADSVADLRRAVHRLLDSPKLRQSLSDGAIEKSRERQARIMDFSQALRAVCERCRNPGT
jgi:glycosyltransferase involved in cell wall biosynthesis